MKRKILLNKISTKIEKNISSKILFSNNLLGDTTMKVETSYRIGEKTFTSIEDAQKYMLEQMIEKGVNHIIENHLEFTSTLNSLIKGKGIPVSHKAPGTRGNLDNVREMLKGKYEVQRDDFSWPVYHFMNQTEHHRIRFTGKVHELVDLVAANVNDMTPIFTKYKH